MVLRCKTYPSFSHSPFPHPTVSNIFLFNETATTEIYTLSLHDALPIWQVHLVDGDDAEGDHGPGQDPVAEDLASVSHGVLPPMPRRCARGLRPGCPSGRGARCRRSAQCAGSRRSARPR